MENEFALIRLRDYVVSLPHIVDNATYQESYAVFVSLAKQASAFGTVMNYGAQPIMLALVKASSDTSLRLQTINQDCKHPY